MFSVLSWWKNHFLALRFLRRDFFLDDFSFFLADILAAKKR